MKDYQKVVSQVQELGVRLQEARQEDRWDNFVRDFCGRRNADRSEGNDPRWTLEVLQAIEELNRKLGIEKERRSQMAREMYRIVVIEKKLAEAEKIQRRREKKKAKRLAKSEEALQAASLA